MRYGLVTGRHPYDGVVGRLQSPGFPTATLLPKLRGSDYYPGGTISHWTRQPSLDAQWPWFKDKVFVGLRGPTVDSIALVVDTEIARGLRLKRSKSVTHFLDLGGLGVRDLARWGAELVVLAGPVTSTNGPFRLFRWAPRRQETIQTPKQVYEWPRSEEHPEGICRLDRDKKAGLLALYDSPDRAFRIHGARYRADWITGA